MNGRIIKSTGSWYKVRLESGALVDARVRGKLRIDGIKSTNPVAVGDIVTLSDSNESDYIIQDVQERKNYIIRKATKLSKQTHIIAANLDLAIVMVTIVQPNLKLGFLDRMLVTAEAYNIPALIVINKSELLTENELAYAQDLCKAYKDIGYDSKIISVIEGSGVEEIKEEIKGKTVLITGHSGVGKSSLVNAIDPSLNARITVVSKYSEKGQHTTTFAELYEINNNTAIIDTPGLKSFGLTSIEPQELKDFFPEMLRLSKDCKFNNCLHLNEPNCRVRDAYEKSELPWFRYEHYQMLLKEISE